MNRREVYPLFVACAVLIVITVLLLLLEITTWREVSWVIGVALAMLAVAVLAYSAYVIFSLEVGYKTEDETHRRMRDHSSHALHPLQTFLHLRARHR